MGSQIWGARIDCCSNLLAQKYMKMAQKKQSLVCLAADKKTIQDIKNLIEMVGEHVVVLKTHVDLIEDWTPAGWKEVCNLAEMYELMIFEDRKFADIGKITLQQMGGIYDIRSWASLVTAHLISGPDVVNGAIGGWQEVNREGAVLLLAQMSSKDNLLEKEYTKKVVSKGILQSDVLGFIGNGSDVKELRKLRKIVGAGKMIWTPGINLNSGEGEMGQRYGGPRGAVLAGSDCIIIGSGIYNSENPKETAKKYAKISWDALNEREKI